MKTKRITMPVSEEIEHIRDRLTFDTGVKMTYNQTISFLIHFYITRTLPSVTNFEQPKTQWRTVKK
jgi:hypothetical protein